MKDVIGSRGENIVELCLTEYANFRAPLFDLTHLGEKWPVVDYYVELTTVPGKRLFFFLQAKATAATTPKKSLAISTKRNDIASLLETPAPTYILGIHEPSKRVFIRSVHDGIAVRAITRMPIGYELTANNLKILHDGVVRFWRQRQHKPTNSVFL